MTENVPEVGGVHIVVIQQMAKQVEAGNVIHFAGHDEPSTLNVDGTLSTGVKPALWASPVVVEVKVRNGSLTSVPLPFEFLVA